MQVCFDAVSRPSSVAISERGDIFVGGSEEEDHENYVWVYQSCTSPLWTRRWRVKGETRIQDLAVYGGAVYVLDLEGQRVQVYREDGCFVHEWHVNPNPRSLAVVHDQVFVVNLPQAGHRVTVFLLNGCFLREWSCDFFPDTIAVCDDLVYVT